MVLKFVKKSTLCLLVVLASFFFLADNISAKEHKKTKDEHSVEKPKVEPLELEVETPDEFNIHSDLYIPFDASYKKRAPLLILLHSLGKSKLYWETLHEHFTKMGIAVLVMDLRGHGRSVIHKRKKRYWQNFKDSEFLKYPDDLDAVINYIREEYLEVDTNKIAIIGSNIGASTGILYAEQNNKEVKTLILLSPIVGYKSVEIRIPVVEYGKHPIMLITDKNNKPFRKSAENLAKYFQGEHDVLYYPLCGDCMNIIKRQHRLLKYVKRWLKTNLLTEDKAGKSESIPGVHIEQPKPH